MRGRVEPLSLRCARVRDLAGTHPAAAAGAAPAAAATAGPVAAFVAVVVAAALSRVLVVRSLRGDYIRVPFA